MLKAILIAVMMMSAGVAQADPGAPGSTSIGLVLVTWAPAFHETEGAADECPEGFHETNRANWLRQFPTKEEQVKFTESYIHLGPNSPAGSIPDCYLVNRGPGGANVAYNPTAVRDAPLREVQSKVAYGLNLDGTTDGRATANTCAHEKFVSPTGEAGIDNQLYRVIGCWEAWRKGGFNVGYYNNQVVSESINRVLLEVTGVDNEQNDDDVDVAIYKGIDGISFDPAGKPLPWLTHRIDTRFPRYMARTHGRIVNGVLKTDPVDARFGLKQLQSPGERLIRGMRLELKLSDTGAEGLVAGYEDLHQWWRATRDSFVDVTDSIGLWNPPSLYEAAHRLADGYPDPKTGQCTAISAAYAVTAVRAFIVRPQPDDPLVTDPIISQHLVQHPEVTR